MFNQSLINLVNILLFGLTILVVLIDLDRVNPPNVVLQLPFLHDSLR